MTIFEVFCRNICALEVKDCFSFKFSKSVAKVNSLNRGTRETNWNAQRNLSLTSRYLVKESETTEEMSCECYYNEQANNVRRKKRATERE
jgi:hypothetical protein